MSFFEKISDKLFPKGHLVTVHELLKRPDAFHFAYEDWKKSKKSKNLFSEYHRSYHHKIAGLKPILEIEIYNSPYANGITLFNQPEKNIPLDFIMEYLKEGVLLLGYRIVNADRRINETSDEVKSIEKYYFKPPLSKDLLIDQYFGNILVELYLTNNHPTRLKCMANIYSDRLYNEPRDFTELINLLFSSQNI